MLVTEIVVRRGIVVTISADVEAAALRFKDPETVFTTAVREASGVEVGAGVGEGLGVAIVLVALASGVAVGVMVGVTVVVSVGAVVAVSAISENER